MAKQLSYSERKDIEEYLDAALSPTAIARIINRDRKTVIEEIKRNRTWVEKGSPGRGLTHCEHAWKKRCQQTSVCVNCIFPRKRNRCWSCEKCEEHCKQFKAVQCEFWDKTPFCCNGCKERLKCNIPKYMYDAHIAQGIAEGRKSEARKGISYTHAELAHMSVILNEGLKKNQSFHHIYVANKDDMYCSERQLYKLQEQGYLDVSSLDMPEKVRRRPKRKKRREGHKVDPKCREGRTYKDYLTYLEENPGVFTVQMDTVEGVREDLKCFLSLSWPNMQLALFFLMVRQTASCVTEMFLYLYQRLGPEDFKALFPVILIDNGSEFSNPSVLEELGTRIFYCDIRASHQKGHIENKNKNLRKIVPKGYSIEKLEFQDSFAINSHINSYFLSSINDKTSIQLLRDLYSDEILGALSLTQIAPNDVVLKPSLLKGKLISKKY